MKIAENLCRQPASQPSLKRVRPETSYFLEYLAIKNVQAGIYNLLYDIETTNGAAINLTFGLGNEIGYRIDNASWRWSGVQNKGAVVATLIIEQSFLDANPDFPNLWIRYRTERVATTFISKGLRIHREGETSDIWTPAHADLTAEQVAVLPPYGEYTVINSF